MGEEHQESLAAGLQELVDVVEAAGLVLDPVQAVEREYLKGMKVV